MNLVKAVPVGLGKAVRKIAGFLKMIVVLGLMLIVHGFSFLSEDTTSRIENSESKGEDNTHPRAS